MTILAPTTDIQQPADELLTPFDVLDIQCALQNAAAADATALNAGDRQALALLTYDRQLCKAMPALLIERILDGTYPLPLDELRSRMLLRLVHRLPDVADTDMHEWLATRNADDDCAAERIIAALVSYVASYGNDVGGGHMRLMLDAALLAVARPDLDADDTVRAVHENTFDDDVHAAGTAARDMVAQVQRGRLTAIDDVNEAMAVAL